MSSNNNNIKMNDITSEHQQLNDTSPVVAKKKSTIFNKKRTTPMSIRLLLITLLLLIAGMSIFLIIIANKYMKCQRTISDELQDIDIPDALQQTHVDRGYYRLPTNIKPVKYIVKIIPFLNNFTFHGEVFIYVNFTSNTNNITVHTNELQLKQFHIKDLNKPLNTTKLIHPNVDLDVEKQVAVFYPPDELQNMNAYELYIKYEGTLNNDMRGLYRSSYNTSDNQVRWIVASQFQATDARRAFPCFDEPALKSKFQISIGRWRNMSSLSNMPKTNSSVPHKFDPNFVWDEYAESVKMSTYLVAMAVTDFKNITVETSSLKFSVWAQPESIARNQASYSFEIGPKILKFYNKFFKIEYPISKMDMIALPDFNGGAMENFGLITFRENSLLYDDKESTSSIRQRVANVVSHELAHQWFGNLVTLFWWNDIWLNEGFASYIECIGVNHVEPNWRMTDLFLVEEVQVAFQSDSLQSSHPLQTEVSKPEEIAEIFDRISYSKGASLLRMIDHFLTNKTLQQGLNTYIAEKSYESSTQKEFWGFLTYQGHKDQTLSKDMDVATIMRTWTLQTGFPLITVTRNYETGSAIVSQERFLLKPTNDSISEKPLWWVPLTFTSNSKANFSNTKPKESHWLKAKYSLILNKDELSTPADDWVIFNLQETGFYRVNYDIKNWLKIIATLRNLEDYTKIHVLNRAQLLDDSLNLAKAGLLDYNIALQVTSYLQHETDLIPWRSAISALLDIESQLCKTGEFDKYKRFMLHIMRKLYDEVGLSEHETDDQLTIYKRDDVVRRMCALGLKDCVNNMVDKFTAWRTDRSSNPYLPRNLKSTITCYGIKLGTSDDWEFVWQKYQNSTIVAEKEIFLSSLSCSSEYWMLVRLLNMAISKDSPIRLQDTASVFGAVAQSAIGHTVAFSFLMDNFPNILKYLNGNQVQLSSILKSCTKKISTESELQQLKIFVRKNLQSLLPVKRTVRQIIENAQDNIDWIQKNYQPIISWLSNTSNYQFTR